MRRILYAWLADWPTRRRSIPPLSATALDAPAALNALAAPLAILATRQRARRVVAICPQAAQAGVQVGMKLAQARALCPGLGLAEADPAGDAAALAVLAQACQRYTPLARPDAPDGVVLDITGCGILFGSEAALAADLQARLAGAGIAARLAIAATLGAAWALAHAAAAPAITVLAAGDEAAALADLPVALLRLDPADAALLVELGLLTIGALRHRPRAELAQRIGP